MSTFKLKHYVSHSERSIAEIADEIGTSPERVHNWIRRGTPIFIEVAFPQGDYEVIDRVRTERIVYERAE